MTRAEIAKLGIARSFQNLELFPSLTVLENLLVARDPKFHGSVFGAAVFFGPARRQEIEQRRAVERVIDFFELWPVRNARAQDLPYGRKRSSASPALWRPSRNCCCLTSRPAG